MEAYQAKLHWISYWLSFLLMTIGLFGIPVLIIGILLGKLLSILGIASLILTLVFIKGLYNYLYLKSIKIQLNRDLISIKGGVLGKWQTDIKLDKLESIYISQSLIGRKLNFGTLKIHTLGGKEMEFFISAPKKLNQEIRRLSK